MTYKYVRYKKNSTHIISEIFNPSKPNITVNSEILDFEWDRNKKIAWLNIHVKSGDKIRINI